jgi:hypothetical protein
MSTYMMSYQIDSIYSLRRNTSLLTTNLDSLHFVHKTPLNSRSKSRGMLDSVSNPVDLRITGRQYVPAAIPAWLPKKSRQDPQNVARPLARLH